MPYDGSGNFTIINSFEEDRVNNVSIDSAKMDNNFNDVANGLSNVMLRTGAAAMSGVLNMASHKIQNVTTGTAASDAVNKGQMDSAISSASSTLTTAYQNYVKTVLGTIYPVGSVYIGTQNTCPMASLITGSTWTLVSSGKALWTGTGSNGNTTIAAGLPNITGKIKSSTFLCTFDRTANGAFRPVAEDGYNDGNEGATWATDTAKEVNFDASKSNAIYGNSSTVQPPAYVVNVWRRTA